jgi:hypothetical protein
MLGVAASAAAAPACEWSSHMRVRSDVPCQPQCPRPLHTRTRATPCAHQHICPCHLRLKMLTLAEPSVLSSLVASRWLLVGV